MLVLWCPDVSGVYAQAGRARSRPHLQFAAVRFVLLAPVLAGRLKSKVGVGARTPHTDACISKSLGSAPGLCALPPTSQCPPHPVS